MDRQSNDRLGRRERCTILNTGGRYNPGTDSWVATSTTNAPPGREFHTAIWTASDMIVWGGISNGSYVNTGGRYNPSHGQLDSHQHHIHAICPLRSHGSMDRQ